MILQVRPLRIGPITLELPAVLAALAGYTNLPYRLICRRLGAPYCSTEAMLDRQLLLPGKLRRRLVHTDPADHPVAGQIMGNDPKVMAQAAAELCREGFDVVDLNFACPVRKVLARRRGGYLMRQPELALEILRAVLAAADRPVTLKLRRAFDDEPEMQAAFWRIAEGAFDAGASAICVHARTAQQRYTGKADWEFLAKVKSHFADKTIIGSGDALTAPQAAELLRQTGVDGVSLARGALGNPWIFRQLADHLAGRPMYRPDLLEQRQLLEAHYSHALQLFGPRRAPKMLRSFGIKYARLHPHPSAVRVEFVNIGSERDWQAVLERHY
jgi:nifR3 family TIM-barrel protein